MYRFEASQLSGNSFGQQLWEAALASCPEQLSGTIDCFEEQHLSGTALQTTSGSSFGFQ